MSRLKKYIDPERRHRGVIPNATGNTHKKVFCALCQDIQMKYDDLKQVWNCPFCGHTSDPKLSQISLTKSQLKASNDFWHSKQKVFFGNGERKNRRIDSFVNQTTYQQSKVYSSLMTAEEATNIHQDPDELD